MSEHSRVETVHLDDISGSNQVGHEFDIDGSALVGLVVAVGVGAVYPAREENTARAHDLYWCLDDAHDGDGWWHAVEASNGHVGHVVGQGARHLALDATSAARYMAPMAPRVRLRCWLMNSVAMRDRKLAKGARAEGIVAKVSYRSL